MSRFESKASVAQWIEQLPSKQIDPLKMRGLASSRIPYGSLETDTYSVSTLSRVLWASKDRATLNCMWVHWQNAKPLEGIYRILMNKVY